MAERSECARLLTPLWIKVTRIATSFLQRSRQSAGMTDAYLASRRFREELFARDGNIRFAVRARACNLRSCATCACRARVSSRSAANNMLSTCVVHGERGRGRERQEGEREERKGAGDGEGEPVSSNYTARFIIYRRQFLLPSRRCIRPTIEG
jgi:hypothetical protein